MKNFCDIKVLSQNGFYADSSILANIRKGVFNTLRSHCTFLVHLCIVRITALLNHILSAAMDFISTETKLSTINGQK